MMQSWKTHFYRLTAAALLLIGLGCSPIYDAVDFPVNTGLTTGNLTDSSNDSDGSSSSGSSSATASPGDCLALGAPSGAIQDDMFDALNRYRAEFGLEPLVYSKRLERAISGHVQDLWVRDFFDHTNPDGDSPGDRAVAAGFCHLYVGENIAAGQPSVAAVMQAWKDSPGHNENMLRADFVYVGMGYFVDPGGRKYWGQAFAFDVP